MQITDSLVSLGGAKKKHVGDMNKVLQVISDLSHLHNLNLGISPGQNVGMGQNRPEFDADFVLIYPLAD